MAKTLFEQLQPHPASEDIEIVEAPFELLVRLRPQTGSIFKTGKHVYRRDIG